MGVRRTIKSLCRLSGIDFNRFDKKPGNTNRPPTGDMGTVLEDLKARGLHCSAILDVGANVGSWTRLASAIFPRAKYFVIEPLVEMRDRLEALCKERTGSRVFLAGAGSKPGNMMLTLMGGDSLSGSSFIPGMAEQADIGSDGPQRSVPVVTINSLIEEQDVPVPDLVKLDIQGFELEALRGASLIFGITEIFILEVSFFPFMSPNRVMFHDVVNFMHERDYMCYDFAGFLRRPLDGALGQADMVFAKKDGLLRHSSQW